MPIIRKIIEVGGSKAVTLPKSWLDYFEKHEGVKIEQVAIEINGNLTIKPIFPKEANKKQKIGEEAEK